MAFSYEPSKDYSGKVAGTISKEDSTSLVFDKLRQIDKRLENLKMCPFEVLTDNELGKQIADPKMKGIWENRLQQVAGMEGTSYGVAIMPNNSHSLVSNEDPWILRHDTPFSPRRPSKIQIRREAEGTKEAP
ncbi:Kinase superfamily with octicosapeptide Phox Bem1p domain isoform 1, partial [Olea europaea subsp. europaea]